MKNIAIVGLGQIGIYLYNELNYKKKEIELKTGNKIKIVAISAKNRNKKRAFKINKKFFYDNRLRIFKEKKIDILFECIGQSDGISKKIVEYALKKKRQKELANQKRFGNTWSKSPKQVDIKSPSHYNLDFLT